MLYVALMQNSYYSTFCKSLISLSTIILLGIMFAYHRLEVQVCHALAVHCHIVYHEPCGRLRNT